MDSHITTDYEKIICLKNILVTCATGGDRSISEYVRLRDELLGNPALRQRLPVWLRTHRNLNEFWHFIQPKFKSYAERREFLRQEFEPALTFLETGESGPAAESIARTLATFDASHIHELWTKALDRRLDDPEGAITAARSLLESVCKCILDECHIEYSDDDDLPKLYTKVSHALNIAPSQHTEQIFKQILGGCHSVVVGLGALRNRLSDAHGKGLRPVKAAPRHAELAVNLAGAMVTFLVATYKEKMGGVGSS